MGTNSRDLRVRFVGDASSLSSTFQEVRGGAAASAAAMTQTDASAKTVGATFRSTGKLAKATGKVFKTSGLDAVSMGSAFASTVPQFGAFTGALGAASIAADGLQGAFATLGPVALPALGAAAIAAGVAFLLLHDDVQTATAAMQAQKGANDEVSRSHHRVAAAIRERRQAVADLRGQVLSGKEAALSLERANRDVAEAEKASGKGSLEHRSALLSLQRAQEAVRAGRRDLVNQAQAVIQKGKDTAKALDAEAASTRKAADEARLRQRFLGTFITGRDAEKASREIAKALDAERDAGKKAAATHRANAKDARAAADALKGDTTPAVVTLRKKLLELAATELDMAQVIGAMNALSGAADDAAAGVQNVINLLSNVPSSPRPPGGRGGKGGGGGGDKGGQKAQARRPGQLPFFAGGNPLTVTDRASLIIGDLHRDDELQDRRTRRDSEAASASGGITNPEEVAARAERAVIRIRRGEIIRDKATVNRAAEKVKGLIKARKAKRAKAYAALRAVKGTSDKAKQQREQIGQAIQSHNQAIRDRYDELNALIRQAADLQTEAAVLGFDIGTLTDQIATLPDVAPPEAPEVADSPGASEIAAGPSPDAQAQIDQANQRAAVAQNESRAFGAFVENLRRSPGIDPAGGTTVVQHIYGGMVQESWAAGWIVDSLARQGRPSSGVVVSPA